MKSRDASHLKKEIRRALARKQETHKGDYGRLFVLAGSTGLTGAAFLVCSGALRAGAGLVTLGIPKSLNSIMEIKLSEAMTKPFPETTKGTLSKAAFKGIVRFSQGQDVIALGPGLSQHIETQELIRKLLLVLDKPLILDADALNALTGHEEILAKIKSFVIITPHVGEFKRVFNLKKALTQKALAVHAKAVALKYKCCVVLKGHTTIVTDGTKLFHNCSGNAGLATGGSGDLLVGMITAFVGQGIQPYEASCYAVYLHGLSADIAAKEITQVSLIPTDLLHFLPRALKHCGIK